MTADIVGIKYRTNSPVHAGLDGRARRRSVADAQGMTLTVRSTPKRQAQSKPMKPGSSAATRGGIREKLDEQLPQPHVGRVPVVLGVPEQVDGDIGQLGGVG